MSGGELSTSDATQLPSGPPPADDFDRGGVIGRGGMGTVEVAREVLLGRDVAMKTATAGDPSAANRLRREAQITGRLDHPGIVPVYRSGTHSDGTPFYTMRLMTGRSLHAAIAAARDLDERLGLVQHVANAAAAMAYAHGQGVLHRDLKPANIMVGALGETVVADWGLAIARTEWATSTGRSVGTRAYMAPEQARGQPLDERADVYGLGAVLHEVITGRTPAQPGDERELAGAPAELVAVVRRATAPHPAQRYATAAELAGDLRAWFEGRRVSAHTYGPWEVAARFCRAWRGALVVAGVSLAVLALALFVAFERTVAERDRAVAATAAARHNLALAHIGQARAAAAADRALDAQSAAILALEHGSSAMARGILARFAGRDRPKRLAHIPWTCRQTGVDVHGRLAVCAGEAEVRRIDLATGETLGTAPHRARSVMLNERMAVFTTEGDSFWIWKPGAEPARAPSRVARIRMPALHPTDERVAVIASDTLRTLSAQGESERIEAICPVRKAWDSVAFDASGDLVTACIDGALLRGPLEGPFAQVGQIPAAEGAITTLSTDPDRTGRVAVGTTLGGIFIVEDGKRPLSLISSGPECTQLALRGTRLAAAVGDSEVSVWDTRTGEPILRMAAARARVALTPSGHLVVAQADGVSTWTLPDAAPPHVVDLGVGLSTVDVDPESRFWAVGTGDGRLIVREMRDARPFADISMGPGVLKNLAFDATAKQLLAIHVDHPMALLVNLDDGAQTWIPGLGRGRRVAWNAGLPWVATYVPGLSHLDAKGQVDRTEAGQLLELDPRTHPRTTWGLDTDRSLWRITSGEVERVGTAPAIGKLARVAGGLLLLHDDRLSHLDESGQVRSSIGVGTEGIELATDEAAGLYAIGYRSAPIAIRRMGDMEPFALLEGHRGRVGAVRFSADGHWLVSAGWDGTVRTWSLDALLADPAELRAELEADLGEPIEARLERTARLEAAQPSASRD